jgi:hypothetical protein
VIEPIQLISRIRVVTCQLAPGALYHRKRDGTLVDDIAGLETELSQQT